MRTTSQQAVCPPHRLTSADRCQKEEEEGEEEHWDDTTHAQSLIIANSIKMLISIQVRVNERLCHCLCRERSGSQSNKDGLIKRNTTETLSFPVYIVVTNMIYKTYTLRCDAFNINRLKRSIKFKESRINRSVFWLVFRFFSFLFSIYFIEIDFRWSKVLSMTFGVHFASARRSHYLI